MAGGSDCCCFYGEDYMNDTYKYLSLDFLESQEKKKKRHLIAGWIVTIFFAFGVVAGIMDVDSDLRKYTVIYFIFILPGLALLWSGYRCGMLNDAARRYETIFDTDRDGIVTMEELSRQINKDTGRIFSELEVLFRKGYFTSCTLQRGGNPCVILSDAMTGETGTGFAVVKCSNCGASSRIRAGSRSQCIYCGAPLEDEV